MKKKCGIVTFLHCKKCLDEMPEGVSPMEYQRVQVGLTASGLIQVWCVRHDMEVATLNRATLSWLKQSKCAICEADL